MLCHAFWEIKLATSVRSRAYIPNKKRNAPVKFSKNCGHFIKMYTSQTFSNTYSRSSNTRSNIILPLKGFRTILYLFTLWTVYLQYVIDYQMIPRIAFNERQILIVWAPLPPLGYVTQVPLHIFDSQFFCDFTIWSITLEANFSWTCFYCCCCFVFFVFWKRRSAIMQLLSFKLV